MDGHVTVSPSDASLPRAAAFAKPGRHARMGHMGGGVQGGSSAMPPAVAGHAAWHNRNGAAGIGPDNPLDTRMPPGRSRRHGRGPPAQILRAWMQELKGIISGKTGPSQ